MNIPLDFKENILEGKLSVVRVILKDSLIIDPTFVAFDEMYKYAKENMDDLLEEFDNEDLDYAKENWSEDYMNDLKIELMRNFSRERLEHLKQVCSFLYQDRIRDSRKRNSSPPRVEYKDSDTKTKLAKGVFVGGLVVTAVGVIAAKTPMIVVGAVTATVGAGVLIIDNHVDK